MRCGNKMQGDGYNPACHINGEKISSVMLAATCCTSPRNITNDNIDDMVETMTIISTVKNPTNKSRQQESNNGGCRRSSKSPSEKNSDAKTTTSAKTRSGANFPSIGASELMGIVPCGREPSSTDLRKKDTGASSNGSRPFASNPLVDRGDSLVGEQASLLSLIASETMETATSPDNTKGGEIGLTPPGQNRVDEQKSTSTPQSSRAKKKGFGGQNEYVTPPRRISSSSQMERLQQSSTPPPPMVAPDSPAMELSAAKQVANREQMKMFRKNSRETLRNYRTIDSSITTSSPSKKARGGGSSVTSETTGRDSASTVRRTPTPSSPDTQQQHHMDFENAPPTPQWTETFKSPVNSELVSTYQYPRLYLRNPILDNDKDWWFQLAQKMETTLKHVQDDHVKRIQLESRNSLNNNSTNCSGSGSISAASSIIVQHQHTFGCATLEESPSTADGCVDMRELCLGSRGQHQHQTTSGKSHRKTKSWSSSHHKLRKGLSTTSSMSSDECTPRKKSFQPNTTPINAWSEPVASTMKVRGKSYAKDGIKIESETSLFSVLGVDSFVSGAKSKDDEDSSGGSKSYLQRWKRACQEVGLVTPPFLLILNFIVPWGNFTVYLTRPDADNGPFATRYKHHPSEKVWREFMDGDTEYRNKGLKLIPRVCAGPWMVKKMIGSTPALIGTKLPVSYKGSLGENFLEICLDVTKGPTFGNSVATTVVGKADVVTVDLGFVVEGQDETHLPEQMLGMVRLHHLNMKEAPTHSQWKEVLSRR